MLETHTQIAPDRRPGTCSYRNSTVRCCQMLNHHHARHRVSDSMVQNIRALSRGALVRSIDQNTSLHMRYELCCPLVLLRVTCEQQGGVLATILRSVVRTISRGISRQIQNESRESSGFEFRDERHVSACSPTFLSACQPP